MAATIEEQILSYIRANARGVSTQDIRAELPAVSVSYIAESCNKFLVDGLIAIYKDKNESVIYKARTPSACADAVRNADNEEKVVYQIVEESGNKGMWIREIRAKSNLMPTQLKKILKNLENKKIIKSVNSITAGKKKLYMKYGLEPDVSLTGGAWYSDEGFDSDFVDALNATCKSFLDMKREKAEKLVGGPLVVNNNSYTSVAEVCKYINNLGLSKIALSENEINQILTTLCFDNKAEKKLSVDGNHLFKAVKSLLPPPGLVRTPCGICPARESTSPMNYIGTYRNITSETISAVEFAVIGH